MREALTVMLAAGRRAIADMQRMLQVLHSPPEAQSSDSLVAPAGLDRLAELAQSGRAVGADVDIQIEGTVRALPAAVDATAYRIVQESVTNVLRHAELAHVKMVVRYDPITCTWRSTTVAPRRRRPPPEDVAWSASGSGWPSSTAGFAAGPKPDGGGWRVTAVLPLDRVT